MNRITVTGATSLVGHFLLPMLQSRGFNVRAISRHPPNSPAQENITWLTADISNANIGFEVDEILIHLAPIWALPDLLENSDNSPEWVIAFSSTSCFSKLNSSSHDERTLAQKLIDAESKLVELGEKYHFDWTIFRPTLVYGAGFDKNISVIASFIKKFGFLPILGRAQGIRMPVHASDLAFACISALNHPVTRKQAYNLSGGESLQYREMIKRIFDGLGKKHRIFTIPEKIFSISVSLISKHPRFQHLTPEMVVRMNQDLAFPSENAQRDFAYAPRGFHPSADDLG